MVVAHTDRKVDASRGMLKMQSNNPNGGGMTEKSVKGARVLVFVARMLASPLEACLRREFGQKYFGIEALASLGLLPLWMAFWPGMSADGLICFWVYVLFMLARARAESLRMLRHGANVHTRYSGWPRLSRWFPRMSEAALKAKYEPAFCFLAGILLFCVTEPLGSFVLVATVGLVLTQSTIEAVERARVMELNDAMIEQQSLAGRFREMQRNQWRR